MAGVSTATAEPPTLDPLPWPSEAHWLLRLPVVLSGVLILGVVARLVRYLLAMPLWPDEAFLAANFINGDWVGLVTEPLAYHQVAPPLYLWIQLGIVQLLGFNEWTLRLFPLLCGLASLFLFRHLAGRLLGGAALVLAVAIFALGYPLLRYAVEAKPYGSDVLATLALMALFVEAWRVPQRPIFRWALVVVAPVTLWLSYPAVFVCGGVSLAWAAAMASRRGWAELPAWLAYNLAVAGSFLGLYLLTVQVQAGAEQYMKDCWSQAFPPLDSLVGFCAWLLATHTSDMLAYPIGGPRGLSALTFVWCLAALSLLAWRRTWPLVLLAVVPLGLNMLAAALQRYPYGGHVRLMLYMAPLICLLAGLGCVSVTRLICRWPGVRAACLVGVGGLILLIPLGSIVRDFVKPYKHTEYLACRNFAQWFWTNHALSGELVCLRADLDQTFSAETFAWGEASVYECNRQIYSPRHAQGQPPDWTKVSAEWPLRCVLYRTPDFAFDEAAFDQWFDVMSLQYQLTDHARYRFGRYEGKRQLLSEYSVEVFEFVPRTSSSPLPPPVLLARHPQERPQSPGLALPSSGGTRDARATPALRAASVSDTTDKEE